MSLPLLLHNGKEVTVVCDSEVIEKGISKLCSIDNHVFAILNEKNVLYHGVLEEKEGKLQLTLLNHNMRVHDIALSPDGNLLYVSEDKKTIYKGPLSNLSECEKRTIHTNVKCDIHGSEKFQETLSIQSVTTTTGGDLIVTDDGHLWAVGNHPSLKVKSEDGLKLVNQFRGKMVLAVASGRSFSMVLVSKKFSKTVENSILKDIFQNGEAVLDCSRCVSENSLTPQSHISLSDTFPDLHNSLNNSSSSSMSKSEPCDDKKDIDVMTSPSTEDENSTKFGSSGKLSKTISSPEILNENETNCDSNAHKCPTISEDDVSVDGNERKILYSMKSGLAKRFTKQLSWVSSYANEETLAEYTEGTSRIVR